MSAVPPKAKATGIVQAGGEQVLHAQLGHDGLELFCPDLNFLSVSIYRNDSAGWCLCQSTQNHPTA